MVYSLFVLMPKGKYSGQKLTRLVSKKTRAKTISVIPAQPVITWVKYSAINIIATKVRKMRSKVPIFFFMALCFGL